MSNEPIEITQVANGYLVRPALRDTGCVTSIESMQVFQSFAELMTFIAGHFDHRSSKVAGDA
jgi:hypothetical protein